MQKRCPLGECDGSGQIPTVVVAGHTHEGFACDCADQDRLEIALWVTARDEARSSLIRCTRYVQAVSRWMVLRQRPVHAAAVRGLERVLRDALFMAGRASFAESDAEAHEGIGYAVLAERVGKMLGR